jgi:hypothetical protein
VIRTRLLLEVIVLLLPLHCTAQFLQKPNVLSYYAVTNSIDGQPLVDRQNVLRFYPVFALKDSVTYVKVIVYHGNEVHVSNAIRFLNGHYWESKLPDFDIGEAIQRYEVEVGFHYKLNYRKTLQMLETKILTNISEIGKGSEKIRGKIQDDALLRQLEDLCRNLTQAVSETQGFANSLNNLSTRLSAIPPDQIGCCNAVHTEASLLKKDWAEQIRLTELLKDTTLLPNTITRYQDTLSNIQARVIARLNNYSCCVPALEILSNSAITLQSLNESLKVVQENYRQVEPSVRYLQNMEEELLTAINQTELAQLITSQQIVTDSIKTKLLRELTDKTYTGDGIQKSDIVFNSDYTGFKLLYRNYRRENRSQVALDPAEKLSIFRVRYIPFPVVDSRLEGPTRKNTPVVFEVGINFGNEVIASNEYAKPELSIKRLGLAAAITPKLFSDEAQILALAVTYEFNAYASVGAGFNFGTLNNNTSRQPYFSFGINQKAFQRLVTGIANVFR